VERIAASGPDRLEVSGRWFGVRGRRFVRPTLTVRRDGIDGEVRSLADLEHKPWAAQDGEPWIAAFELAVDLADADAEIELSVAPDIAVALSVAGESAATPGDQIMAARSARTPVAKSEPKTRPRRPRGASPEVEQLTARLANASQALDAERERRAAVDEALEAERSTSRQLRIELGQARAELELASASETAAAAAAQELDATRHDLREARRRTEQLGETHRRELAEAAQHQEERDREHALALEAAQRRHAELERERDKATQAHAAGRSAFQERTGALESAREALARERSESGRLRKRLARAEKSGAAPSGPATAEQPAAALPDSPAPRLAPSTRARPLNPSLRHRTYWIGRTLALLVLLIVLAAIWIVLHSTILNH
jgi:hypothetical protein